uniref:NADH dehydrogenase subunit 6 n=1 Tax=Schistosoma japonicum TaxID=6182 RepID=G9B136_SCHJA|nr:NADH dehydrogenase subunit 6 [Schistosoma japonicum]
MITSLFCITYFICMYCFTFSGGSLFRVFLIVVSSFSVGMFIFYCSGSSWYFLLFVLIYFGGVYILFVYISMMLPNSGVSSMSFSYFSLLLVFFFFFFVFFFCYEFLGTNVIEYSFYLCSDFEAVVYNFFCLILLFGMFIVSLMISSVNEYSR